MRGKQRHLFGFCLVLPLAVACGAEQGADPSGQLEYAVCRDVNLVPNDADGVAPVGTVIEWAASPSCDLGDTPVYEFYHRPPDGAWELVRAYDTEASFSWDSTGEIEGEHRFQVWVKDVESESAYTAYSGRTFVLGSFDACGPATVTADPPSPTPAGENLRLSLSADCGSNQPDFRLEYQTDSGAWESAEGWDPSTSRFVSSASLQPGVNQFRVSTRPYLGPRTGADTTVGYQHEVLAGCTNVTLGASPPQQVVLPGTSVVLEANATCGGTAEYQFWLQAPGAEWVEAQPYGVSNTWTFDTEGLAGGEHRLQVWVRNQGRSAVYEAWTSRQIRLASACNGSALTADTPSPSAAGATITLTARAASCELPEFRFLMRPPGGAWETLQTYGPSANMSWDTDGAAAGTYLFQVWTRLAGTTASYQSWAAYQHVIQ